MKQARLLFLCLLLLAGSYAAHLLSGAQAIRSTRETLITLSDDGITVNGGSETDSVFVSHDIIYYEDKDTYPSGRPYGEGLPGERHSPQEAAAHTVVNITAPGTYRLSGALSAGQIRVDLGEDAYYDPKAVVTLILDDASVTCTVAPAILFLNAYECDNNWSSRAPAAQVDTSHAGARLVLEGDNVVQGSHVAKIFKDKKKSKKLWKHDGAIQSNVSLLVNGPGSLTLTGDKEGLSSELHLTILGGDINILAQDDGINASELNMSVLTIHDGNIRVHSGLSEEGDGIDSNGYLILEGGTVIVWSNPGDSPLDGEKIYANGGTVLAFGSDEDTIRGDSKQVSFVLIDNQFPVFDHTLVITDEDGQVALAYDASQDDFLGGEPRFYQLMAISSPNLELGKTYQIHAGATVTGTHTNGLYQEAQLLTPGRLLVNIHNEEPTTDFYTKKTVSFYYFEYPAA